MNATKELTFNLLNKFQDKERFGSAQRHAGISLKGFISGILFSFLYFLFQLSLFIILRSRFKTIYQANVVLKIHPGSKVCFAKKKIKNYWSLFAFLKQLPGKHHKQLLVRAYGRPHPTPLDFLNEKLVKRQCICSAISGAGNICYHSSREGFPRLSLRSLVPFIAADKT